MVIVTSSYLKNCVLKFLRRREDWGSERSIFVVILKKKIILENCPKKARTLIG